MSSTVSKLKRLSKAIKSPNFWEAVVLIDAEKSGNPQEKYKPGIGILKGFNREAMKNGIYKPYIEDVMLETALRLPELERQIELSNKATFTVSLEHRDPEAYRKQKELDELLEIMAA